MYELVTACLAEIWGSYFFRCAKIEATLSLKLLKMITFPGFKRFSELSASFTEFASMPSSGLCASVSGCDELCVSEGLILTLKCSSIAFSSAFNLEWIVVKSQHLTSFFLNCIRKDQFCRSIPSLYQLCDNASQLHKCLSSRSNFSAHLITLCSKSSVWQKWDAPLEQRLPPSHKNGNGDCCIS